MIRKIIFPIFLTVALLSACVSNLENPASADGAKIPLQWRVGYAKSAQETPADFVPAKVPGSVQLDIARAKNYPTHHYSTHAEKYYQWLEDMHYTYRASFKKPPMRENQRLFIDAKGIDYKYAIFVNGREAYAHEGIFKGFQLDITDFLKDGANLLEVKIDPVPKAFPEKNLGFHDYRANASRSVKPPVSYGWDWHPRLIPLGIWDSFDLEVRNASNLTYAALTYKMSDDLKTAALTLDIRGNNIAGCGYAWQIFDADGKLAAQNSGKLSANAQTIQQGDFNNPNLWWTHDHGVPYLYDLKISLLSPSGKTLETKTQKIGFRKIRLVMNEGEWARRTNLNCVSQSNRAPMQIELNGKKIFAKGSNWVNPEVFYSELDKSRYEPLVKLAVEANFNIFRVWGGAIVNKEPFFDLCDELGILVWQEFPLACNNYPDEARYVSLLRDEARAIVERVRVHPSIAVWCGGNELFNNWSGMSPQSIPLRMLNAVCLELDPETPFNFTSPLFGVGHGHYKFKLFDGDDAMTIFSKNDMVAYTEFGVNGAASVEAIKRCIPQNELFPPAATPSWIAHFGTRAFRGDGWLFLPDLESYVGKMGSLEELVDNSQFMQAQGYKALFEEARRQKPMCSMAINWNYNEAWTVVAGNALVEYPATRKPAFYAVKDSCRPAALSGKFSSITWRSGDVIDAEIWILNDTFGEIDAQKIDVYVINGGAKTLACSLGGAKAKANRNAKAGDVKIKLPKLEGRRFEISVESPTNPSLNSVYGFIVKKEN